MTVNFELADKSAIKVSNLQEVLRELDNYYIPPISSQIDLSRYAEKIKKNAEILFMKFDTNIVGMSALYCNDYDNFTAFITTIGMKKKYQGQGLGKKLLEKSIELARSKGMKKIKLEVNENNKKAINFYKRNNFTIEEERIRPKNDRNSESWFVMEKLIE